MNFKLLLLLSMTILFTVFAKAQAPIPEILYYRFNESGTIVPNYASNPPSGTDTAYVIGGLTQGPSGQCGNALIGNGQASNSNYVNTGWQTQLTGTSWTMSFWTSNVPSTTTTYYIAGDINAGQLRVFTGGVAGAGNWILRGAFTDVYANGGASTGPSMTTFVYDMPNNEIRSYVNGVLSSTVAQAMVAITGTGPFKVGGYATNNSLPPGSLMDEFRLYNRALTPAEIQSLLIAGTSHSFSVTTCGSYTVPSNDETYTTSGIYMDTIPNANGCDSILTIDLTILPLSYDTISPVVCDQYTSPSGNYNWISSGIYTDTLTNSVGCDSIVTINLTVNQTMFDTITESACNSYTAPDGSVYSSTGTYAATIMSTGGCDSIITIHLTVEQMDTTVSYSGGTLTANQAGVSYQWIDCGTMNPVSGATSQSFSPSSNGNYFVNLNGTICAISSDCYAVTDLGLDEFSQLNLELFPNPVSDELNIVNNSGEELILELYDNAGKLLQTFVSSETNCIVEMQHKAAGIYHLKARSKFAERTFRIVRN